jgi:hypothetical protein
MGGRKNEPNIFTRLKWLRYAVLATAVVLLCAVPYGIYLFATNQRKPVDLNQAFGCENIPGVEESGFDKQEQQDGRPFRWTKGVAKLVVPIDKNNPPRTMAVIFRIGSVKGTLVQLYVNDQRLLDQVIPHGDFRKTFDLTKIKLGGEVTIKLVSDTFVPKKEDPKSSDPRALGVDVQAIRLLAQAPSPTVK